MNSLTGLATKCRFAVLEVSDDEDEEKPQVEGDKAGTVAGRPKGADANNDAKAKKKRKKKKNRSKNNQSSGDPSNNDQDIDNNEPNADHGEWDEWMQKDEQFVLSQFQRDLKLALEASKIDTIQTRQKQELTSTQAVSQEITKEKKKKEKPIPMSLSEFRQTGTTEGIQCAPKSESSHSVTGLDSFLEWPDDSTIAVTLNHERSNIQGTTFNEMVQVERQSEEKPSTPTKPVKVSGRKKNDVKSDTESRNQNQVTKTLSEKKLFVATHEDEMQAEMVHIKDELDKTGHELTELRKAKVEHIKIIEDLKKELSQVKKRNKQLCFILSQAEMKEKSELLMQIEELNEVKEQVVQLHAELEQERSKNSALKNEMAKSSGGRQRHGSS
ncbi:G kinase-anchoring protein 1-like isoform X1 [Orbicella faveolata]|uniref:G kinase-anchoring protein 1-like isoform X1 n=1 Tax=Orbicella faveolata TaxID=48498 RepID=UPI0009E637C3|nr:G kinase-anchoring protein 1-like isoform X1 [Orbicella faveolata]